MDIIKEAELTSSKFRARLINIPGQSYTFGTEFPGRKKNDEFVFCLSSLQEPSQFRIYVDDKREYWIQQISAKIKTFVNRVEITEKPIKLKFGDTIGIRCKTFNTFQFKKSTPKVYEDFTYRSIGRQYGKSFHCGYDGHYHFHNHGEEQNQNEDKLSSKIGQDLVIIREILNKFSIKDLLPLRLVCPVWDDVITQIMRGNAEIILSFDEEDEYDDAEGLEFFLCAHEMRNLEIQRLKLVLPNVEVPDDEDADFPEVVLKLGEIDTVGKLSQDLTNYLESKKKNIKFLSIDGRIGCGYEFKLFETTFQKLSNSLIGLTIKANLNKSPPPFQKKWNFEKLQSLTAMDFNEMEEMDEDEIYSRPLRDKKRQLKWAKNVVLRINLNSLKEFHTKEYLGSSSFLKEIVSRNFPNLSTLSIQNGTGKSLKLLLNLTSPITKLHLNKIRHISVEENLKNLEKVLEKYARSIPALTLGIKWTKRELNLPLCFPQLEKLKLMYSKWSRIKSPWEDYISYSKLFPKLRKLCLKGIEDFGRGWKRDEGGAPEYAFYNDDSVVKAWRENENVFNLFFPFGHGEICKTLTELNVYHLNHYFKPECKDYIETVKGLSSLFPKADHRWVKVACAFKLSGNGKSGYEIETNLFRFYPRPYLIPRRQMRSAVQRQALDGYESQGETDSGEETGESDDDEIHSIGDTDESDEDVIEIADNTPETIANKIQVGNEEGEQLDDINPQPGPSHQPQPQCTYGNVIPSKTSASLATCTQKETDFDDWKNLWTLLDPKFRKIAEKCPKAASELQLKMHELVNRYEVEHLFQ